MPRTETSTSRLNLGLSQSEGADPASPGSPTTAASGTVQLAPGSPPTQDFKGAGGSSQRPAREQSLFWPANIYATYEPINTHSTPVLRGPTLWARSEISGLVLNTIPILAIQEASQRETPSQATGRAITCMS